MANIKKLYIKLDKKLIVKADYISIKKNFKKTDTKSQLLELKNYLRYFYELFNEIDIKKLKYQNQLLSLKYRGKNFYLETDEIYIKTAISLQNRKTIKLDAKKIYIKKFQADLKGIVNINFDDDKVDFDGNFLAHKLKGKLKLTLQNSLLRYYIYDMNADTIAPFMDFLNQKVTIIEEVSNWIYKYIVAKRYKLSYLYGIINIDTGEYYPSLMRGEATGRDVKVKFRKNLPATTIKKLAVHLINDTLSFDLTKPAYEGIDLNGSKVTINRLLTKGTTIKVTIKATHPFDKKIKNILKAYKVSVPLIQIKGATKAKVVLTIPFVPYSLDIKGDFITNSSIVEFKNIKFHTKKARIKLDNSKITLINSNISYKNLFDLNSSGIFKTDTNIYKGKIKISKLFLKYKNETLLDSNKSKSSIVIDFRKGTIFLKDLNSKITFTNNKNSFALSSLKKIQTLSPLLKKYHVIDGNAEILTKDFKKFLIDSIVKIKKQNVILYKNAPLEEFSLNGVVDDKNIKLSIDNNLIKIKLSKDIKIDSKNISFNLKDIIDNNSSKKIEIKKPLILKAKNSTVYLSSNIAIPTDEFTFFANKDKKIFSSIYKNNHIFYSKDSKQIDIETNFITADYFSKIIGYKIFQDGAFLFNIKEKKSIFQGNCKVVKTTIKSIKKGGSDFKIDNGSFDFTLKNHLLYLKNMVLNNKYSTLKGGGYIDIKNRMLNLKYKVTILKNLGKSIDSIPLIGYILLGKKGKFTSQVTITGSFENPQIKTDFAKDVIKSPFNMLFRVIKLPFKLFSPSK